MNWHLILSPLLTFALFLAGLYIWRRQMVAKRRFEIAEQVIAATAGALDGLAHIRSPIIWAGELAAVEVPKEVTGEDADDMRQRGAYFARAKRTEKAFFDLRVAQVLAEIHLTADAVAAIDDIFRARQEVLGAVDTYFQGRQMSEVGMEGEQLRELRELKVALRRALGEHRDPQRKPEPTDKISIRMDVAKETIEAACRPFLK